MLFKEQDHVHRHTKGDNALICVAYKSCLAQRHIFAVLPQNIASMLDKTDNADQKKDSTAIDILLPMLSVNVSLYDCSVVMRI